MAVLAVAVVACGILLAGAVWVAPDVSAAAAPSAATSSVSPARAPSALPFGDSTQTATLSFNVCPEGCGGVHVFIDSASNHFGPGGYSLCTAKETSTDFWPTYNGETRQISMLAKAGGSCLSLPSYNTWIVAVYRNDKLVGRGLVWLGEDYAGLAKYYSTCNKVKFPSGEGWITSQLRCSDDQPFHFTVSVPGYKPTWPACPSSTEFCSLSLHLDANLYCPNITASAGSCVGASSGNVELSTNNVVNISRAIYSGFTWSGSNGRSGATFVTQKLLPVVEMSGTLPNDHTFAVRRAIVLLSGKPGSEWQTSTKAPAGAPGGPLVFHFQNGVIGADVYIQGFLQRK